MTATTTMTTTMTTKTIVTMMAAIARSSITTITMTTTTTMTALAGGGGDFHWFHRPSPPSCEIPPAFRDPITQEVMGDPVTASDGACMCVCDCSFFVLDVDVVCAPFSL